ncbi:hypothetical protein [Fervidobacterium nodosum]|uniref:Uncharacterized protein n=1 Tax=Fervidobacterium nodosum (strain ATCC 35602 / DSM 5306 / Rt17-B1) TaxID=381764 RepID=A7HL53_FERNB|nr:hypothetical protein [Fervidobacterium nodosum]ABS60636.1 conserved hypothetical protein [Fervidobacterium nodosum Rt17-B1]PHJ13638.1 hypothetical protein IM41_05250 [Fervidobacterium sp. SC_NGM5_G05]
MRIEGLGGIGVNPYVYQNASVKRSEANPQIQQAQAQVQQSSDMMLKLLEFAFYKQNAMNLKLVRIAGELYQGKNFDALA